MKKLIILIDDDINSPIYAANELGVDKKYFIHVNEFLKPDNILTLKDIDKCYTIYSFATYNQKLINRLHMLECECIAFRSEKMRQFVKDLDKQKSVSIDFKNINKMKEIAIKENLIYLYNIISSYENMINENKQITWLEYLQNIIVQICRNGGIDEKISYPGQNSKTN